MSLRVKENSDEESLETRVKMKTHITNETTAVKNIESEKECREFIHLTHIFCIYAQISKYNVKV